MAPVNLPFSQDEYDARLAKVRRMMEIGNLEALFITDPSNMAWISGYDGWSFYVHQGLIVKREGEPIWWGRAMDAAGALRTVWMSEESITSYDDTYVQSLDSHPMQDLALQMTRLHASSGRIGVELDNYYFTARAMATINASLPNALWVDITGEVNRLRAVKSEAEIGFMRKAARISEKIIDGLLERVEPIHDDIHPKAIHRNRALEAPIQLLQRSDVLNVYHFRKEHVYPVYDLEYKARLETVLQWLDRFENFFAIGRPGRFRYTNQDHSLELGILAARSVLEGKRHVVEVGMEDEYFEKGYVPGKH